MLHPAESVPCLCLMFLLKHAKLKLCFNTFILVQEAFMYGIA